MVHKRLRIITGSLAGGTWLSRCCALCVIGVSSRWLCKLRRGRCSTSRHRHEAYAELLHPTSCASMWLAGKALTSGQGMQTRPMMGKVRSALFDMLLAMCSGGPHFPSTTRWLDLYAGAHAHSCWALPGCLPKQNQPTAEPGMAGTCAAGWAGPGCTPPSSPCLVERGLSALR